MNLSLKQINISIFDTYLKEILYFSLQEISVRLKAF
jgi:hypothetical protein